MTEWAFSLRKVYPFNSNEYSLLHDDIVEKLRQITLAFVSTEDIEEFDNLQLLVAVAKEQLDHSAVNKSVAEKIWKYFDRILSDTNFVKIGKIHEEDELCMNVIARLWLVLFDNLEDAVIELLKHHRTHFEGWNLDHEEMYRQVKTESFLMSAAIRLVFMADMNKDSQDNYWRSICTHVVNRMNNCDNEYISADYFFLPLVLAEYYASQNEYDGLAYLRSVFVNKVNNIGVLLKIFYLASSKPDAATSDRLLGRIEKEWPSCKELMKLRRQTEMMENYENVIKNITA